MTLNDLVEQLCSTNKIYWHDDAFSEAVFTENAIADLLEHQADIISKDYLDGESGLMNWVDAEDAVILAAQETDAFQGWDCNNGRFDDE